MDFAVFSLNFEFPVRECGAPIAPPEGYPARYASRSFRLQLSG